jgi:hypothetical protein
MDERHSELDKLVDSSVEATGITLKGPDGRLYFLTDDEIKRKAMAENDLHYAYTQARDLHRGSEGDALDSHNPCVRARAWLDTHSPDSEKWKAICLKYFDVC